jgi:hypothetical protein
MAPRQNVAREQAVNHSLFCIEYLFAGAPLARRYREIAVSMFGSNDDKKTQLRLAKSLFGWRKAQEPPSNSHGQFLNQRQLRPLCCQSPSQCCNGCRAC